MYQHLRWPDAVPKSDREAGSSFVKLYSVLYSAIPLWVCVSDTRLSELCFFRVFSGSSPPIPVPTVPKFFYPCSCQPSWEAIRVGGAISVVEMSSFAHVTIGDFFLL